MIAFHMVDRRVSQIWMETLPSGLAPGITRTPILIASDRP